MSQTLPVHGCGLHASTASRKQPSPRYTFKHAVMARGHPKVSEILAACPESGCSANVLQSHCADQDQHHQLLLPTRCHGGSKDSKLRHFNWTKASSQCFSVSFTSGACKVGVGGRFRTASSFFLEQGRNLSRESGAGQPSLVCKDLLGCLCLTCLLLYADVRQAQDCQTAQSPSRAPRLKTAPPAGI